MFMKKSILLVPLFLLIGCAAPTMSYLPDYQERPKLESSLFRSDQVIMSQDVVDQIMNSKIVLPEKIRIALIKYEGNDQHLGASKFYGYYYWRSEDYLKLQQHFIDTVSAKLLSLDRVVEVTPLPTMLLPKDATVPVLREAAVRLQSDVLLIFRLTSDTYYKYVFLGKDRVKAFSTCEFVVFDVRTGIIPFTTIITKEILAKEGSKDVNKNDLMKRAEREASIQALTASTDELILYFNALAK